MGMNGVIDKDEFLEKYGLKKYFDNAGCNWEELMAIYQNYLEIQNSDYFKQCCREIEEACRSMNPAAPIHSIRCRCKAPEHVIEKIIRKRGKEQNHKYIDINDKNYSDIIRDLIGVRILIFKKEDWERVFDEITKKFPKDCTQEIHIAEEPVAYIRYGDRDIFKNKIHKEYTNKGYRSQHYIVKFKKFYCEIQVRTLAEEVYGEFDHMVKYPYRSDNNFLIRYTSMVSKLTDAIDESISTCLQMNDDCWDYCSKNFAPDIYSDWQHTSQVVPEKRPNKKDDSKDDVSKNSAIINMKLYANNILYRKDN